MDTKMKCFIFGGNSTIGRLTAQAFDGYGMPYVKTSRTPTNNEIFFDLNKTMAIEGLNKNDTAVISCGLTSIEKCENNPEEAIKANVLATKDLIIELAKKNIFFVFLSTSSIFEGQKLLAGINDEATPLSVYAKTKYEIEKFCFAEIKENFAILRMTKVVSEHWDLLNNWKNKLNANCKIHPFSNRYFSPVNGTGVADLIYYLVKSKEKGIYQLGGISEISYSEFCFQIFKNNQFATSLIQPIPDTNEWRSKLQTPNLITTTPKEYIYENKIFKIPEIGF